VKPTTGGGVVFGMTCAQVAAGVVYEALQSNDFSRTYLSRYGERCKEIMGFDTRVMLTMRKALNSLSDGKLDDMIALSTRLRLEETLQNVEDIDSQGQAFLRVLKSPRMLTVLGYISFLLLSANL
jgi:flavin-dependent dehydrogenase